MMACDNDDHPSPAVSMSFSLNSIYYYTNTLYKHTYLHYPALTSNLEIRFLILGKYGNSFSFLLDSNSHQMFCLPTCLILLGHSLQKDKNLITLFIPPNQITAKLQTCE
ncbi:hypothetical protein CIPAW_14G002900 [Carya illinoinensis]|uniref:Uncharacterized protein n=1 Tax=Carya illinoinensis TaxID=32201 RepID=A0A8T1NEI2_CARIL|nr:hypothetical protein CIPAW_14G002900 [Carya illinoinensis]